MFHRQGHEQRFKETGHCRCLAVQILPLSNEWNVESANNPGHPWSGDDRNSWFHFLTPTIEKKWTRVQLMEFAFAVLCCFLFQSLENHQEVDHIRFWVLLEFDVRITDSPLGIPSEQKMRSVNRMRNEQDDVRSSCCVCSVNHRSSIWISVIIHAVPWHTVCSFPSSCMYIKTRDEPNSWSSGKGCQA